MRINNLFRCIRTCLLCVFLPIPYLVYDCFIWLYIAILSFYFVILSSSELCRTSCSHFILRSFLTHLVYIRSFVEKIPVPWLVNWATVYLLQTARDVWGGGGGGTYVRYHNSNLSQITLKRELVAYGATSIWSNTFSVRSYVRHHYPILALLILAWCN